MPKLSRLEVIANGARRRWTDEEKARIVAESFDGPRRVSATARRYGLTPSQLFTWRRQLASAAASQSAATQTAPTFTPVYVACEPAEIATAALAEAKREPGPTGRMEIALANGRRIIVGADVDAPALARVVDVLERRA
jgi:transposase